MSRAGKYILSVVLLCMAIPTIEAGGPKTMIVESIRKDRIVTVLFDSEITKRTVIIHIKDNQNREYMLDLLYPLDSQGIRYCARPEKTFPEYIAVGSVFSVIEKGDIRQGLVKGGDRSEEKKYRVSIVSVKDTREMIFIEPGLCFIGNDAGEKDERPRHMVRVEGFYIDKYEVTNGDYFKFVIASGARNPRIWGNRAIDQNDYGYPVIVSYREAEIYAKWVGKRLPTEEEWEKAASSTEKDETVFDHGGYVLIKKQTEYSWGDQFRPDLGVSMEFWKEGGGTGLVKKGFYPGPLMSKRTEFASISARGICDMSGNVPEWTSSWYRAYPGNTVTDFRFGEMVKVIRGGGWFSGRSALRVTSRDYGGIPNLEEDSIAGFRCVKNPSPDDLK
jgi:formylglycine-generating enzyme required for sulfatase activity